MNRNSVLGQAIGSHPRRDVQEHYVGGQETAWVFRVCEGSDPHKLTSWKLRGARARMLGAP